MKKQNEHILLHLSGLADGDYTFAFELAEGALELPDSFREKVDVIVDLSRLRSQYVVNCKVTTSSVHICDRCLEPVRLHHEPNFTVVYNYGSGGADTQIDEDDLRLLDPSDPKIDLTSEVREALILCVPMRITCGENEQSDPICTNPYLQEHLVNENATDPRWEILKSKIQTTE
jgi:uncharacterized metal-binding protein YceD (DUF177 family)